MPDDQRIRPTIQGRARLLQVVAAVSHQHLVDPGALGEYAQVLVERGPVAAERQLPEVARHLESGCQDCASDLDDLIELAADPDAAPPAERAEQALAPPGMAAERPAPANDSSDVAATGLRGAGADPSGFHVRDLPDPRQAEARADAELLRRQQLRRWRERLLIAAAVAVVAMGLSLIGLAYLAQTPRETPRLDLAPAPVTTPAGAPEQPVPAQSAPSQSAPAQFAPVPPTTVPATLAPSPPGPPPKPASAGVTAPSGMDCPPSHPIKGNRSSMIYHLPGGGFYGATRPEQCFAQPSDAEAAGYRRSQR